MKKLLLVSSFFSFCILLSSCAESECKKLGFTPGTELYGQCIMHERKKWDGIAQGIGNSFQQNSYNQQQNDQASYNSLMQYRRRTNCTSNFIGNTMYTNCY